MLVLLSLSLSLSLSLVVGKAYSFDRPVFSHLDPGRSTAMNSKTNEPGTAPPAEQWFPLKLGSTLRDPSPSSRFYSLRYEFKPASIDTMRPGSLLKSTDNKVTVEFCNNQAGKPKVSFQGNSEDCKELDAVIFFDGKSFRLERLHRAVKSLRLLRLPGESAASTNVSNIAGSFAGLLTAEPANSPAYPNGVGLVPAANVNVEKINPLVQVEETTAGRTETSGDKKSNKRKADAPAVKVLKGTPRQAESPIEGKGSEVQIVVETDIVRGRKETEMPSQPDIKIDEEVVSDYEIEDVDASDDEDGVNAAEALRAQGAVSQKQESSSESSGSGSGSSSGSSDSGSGSSSNSGSGSDDEDSASSGGDI